MSADRPPASVSIGIAAAAMRPREAAVLARRIEDAGFAALWVNDSPGADALEILAAAASATERLTLAVGVIPVDRRPAPAILDDVGRLELPVDRLVVGIGAGRLRRGALAAVAAACLEVRAALPSRVVAGALGPRMRHAGAANADGVLLSWLTPGIAAAQASEARDTDERTHVALYVRAAVDGAARDRLADEASRYAGVPAYAANFDTLGIRAQDTVIDPDGMDDRLAAYRASVDEVVLRAVPVDDGLDAHLAFVDRVSRLL